MTGADDALVRRVIALARGARGARGLLDPRTRMRAAAAVLVALAQSAPLAPAAVRQAVESAGITSPIAAWCEGEFRAGQRGYAVAAGGRYLVADGQAAAELGRFSGKPDLSCYTRAQALDLHRDLQRSDTVSGEIAPRFATAVICAFVEATTAQCWQYSPAQRAYVDVGGWTT